MQITNPYIVMPVKDSVDRAEQAIRAIREAGYEVTVYNDNSTPPNTSRLEQLAERLGFTLVNIGELTPHPSPNYLFVLTHAQAHALQVNAHLLIVESDVVIHTDTIPRMLEQANTGIGMVAAVTTDETGAVIFPYQYARHWRKTIHDTKKRLSFCCTLLTNQLLHAYDFSRLDPSKNWYDVFISHLSVTLGLHNLLMTNNPVLHYPHSSRPWKQLKYKRPLLYYWRKITQHRDKI